MSLYLIFQNGREAWIASTGRRGYVVTPDEAYWIFFLKRNQVRGTHVEAL